VWAVVLIGYQPVPRDWFPADLAGAAVLCLASGGGQQGPVLAAAGAAVTVSDNSPTQLSREEEVAARDELAIRTVLGDMRDLSVFPDASFDVVFNPVSNVFCPDLAPVWRESFRVLRPGGILLAGFLNPDIFIFDIAALGERGEVVVRHRLPFTTLDLPDAERLRSYGTGPIEYSHSLTQQIGGQLAAGFTLTHLGEARIMRTPRPGTCPVTSPPVPSSGGSPAPSRLSRHSSSHFLLLTRCTRPDHGSRLPLQRAGKHQPSAPHQARLRPGVLLVLDVMSWGLVMATYLGSAAQSSPADGSSRTPVASSAVLLAEPYSFLPTPQ
jgi:SAM-dependent methyltransferase